MNGPTKKPLLKTGRPRSTESHQAILDAAFQMFIENGYQALSIEGIAARAGVGKTTIYRRWDNKEALVIEALAQLEETAPIKNTGNLREDILTTIRTGLTFAQDSKVRLLLPQLVGAASTNPEFLTMYYNKVIHPRVHYFEEMLREAQVRGELRVEVDINILTAMIAGPVLLQLFNDPNQLAGPDFANNLFELISSGIFPR